MSSSTWRRPGAWVAVGCALVAGSASASDKYDRGGMIDSARRPAAGKALVYFVRPQLMGAAVKNKLFADGTLVTVMGAKTWAAWEGDSGKHEFATEAENAGLLDAELAPDRIYFVQVAIHMGAMKARTHFEVARPGSEAAEEVGKKLHEVKEALLTEEGKAWVAGKRAKIDEKLAKYRAKGEEIETMKPEDGAAEPPFE
ncbi:MAG: hypothetical protein ACREQY_10415 [Candidatus Binatia bacterium]